MGQIKTICDPYILQPFLYLTYYIKTMADKNYTDNKPMNEMDDYVGDPPVPAPEASMTKEIIDDDEIKKKVDEYERVTS